MASAFWSTRPNLCRILSGVLLGITSSCSWLHGPATTGSSSSNQPEKEARTAIIAFYNLENLFDTKDDPKTDDVEFTPAGARQWDALRYSTKLRNLASVIAEIGPSGPDVLGINEAENLSTLRDLTAEPLIASNKYEIIHFDSPDPRGIDVGLLYRPDRFQPQAQRAVPMLLPDTTMGTRDLLVVDGLLNGEPITFMVAHWPSRMRGARAIARRLAVAKQCRQVIDEKRKADPQARIVLMGDLNDTPADSSVSSVLGAGNSVSHLPASRLFNPYYDLQMQGKGTMYYRSRPDVFDQMILSDGLLSKTGLRYVPGSAAIFKPERITSPQARWPGEPLRTFAGRKYIGGYSDHFPVYLTLSKQQSAKPLVER